MSRAALYVHGRIVTGLHHGEAYSKLTAQERCENICSGEYDEEHQKFIAEDRKEFYHKKIILVRHAQAENDHITDYGITQVRRAALFLEAFVNLSEYKGFTSPASRCQETAAEFKKELGIQFEVTEQLAEKNTSLEVLKNLLENLPIKSFLVSHCNLIVNLAQLATGVNTHGLKIGHCCINFIKDDAIVQLGNI